MSTPIFGYPQLYSNGLNNNTQIRRSSDMVYQRGGNYGITLTGNTYQKSIELDVDLFANNQKVGRMSLVPFQINDKGSYFEYNFNLRAYDYLSNYIQSQHYTYYWLNDYVKTTEQINFNNPYPNIIETNFKYGWRYISGSTSNVTEYVDAPANDYYHFTDIPYCYNDTTFHPSGFTNTGPHFNYVGGAFQMATNKYLLPNFDQEMGTVIGTGYTISGSDIYRRLSPISPYLMDYPTVPEMSETSRFLTNAPRIQYIQSSENYVLYFLNGQTGDRQVIQADWAVFEFYDSSNTRILEHHQKLNLANTPYASPTGNTNTLTISALPCGPVDITNLYANPNWDNIAYYRVQLFYGYPTNVEYSTSTGPVGPVSEEFFFYVQDNCGPENTRIAFLNSLGAYDYFTFTSYRNDVKKISSQTFDSRYYSTDLASADRDYGRSVKTFATDLNQEIVLESNYLNVQQGGWLQELFYSPQVYLVSPDFISPIDLPNKVYKDLTPLQVLSTEVETITKKHNKLNKYRITFKTADSFFVNRGF